MNQEKTHIKRALLSVSDKTGIVEFAKQLHALNVELISTGGTHRLLQENDIPVQDISSVTDFPEIMDGRVKTLHPKVHGGILGLRDAHADQAAEHGLAWFDLVVCNLYPFANTIMRPDVSFDEVVENIDIGGPSMLRAAAKNMGWVAVTVDVNDYDVIVTELKAQDGLSFELRKKLATKAFQHTAYYDSLIGQYMGGDVFPDEIAVGFRKQMDLRYGENPHQLAAVYADTTIKTPTILNAVQHQGKQLSYNNIADADGALNCVAEFTQPTCVVVKHANPCGVACAETIEEAFDKAYYADSQSAFGGIVALNEEVGEELAQAMSAIFFEIIIAPSFSEQALSIFSAKPNLRLLALNAKPQSPARWQYKAVQGGMLVQEMDTYALSDDDLQVVTKAQPSVDDLDNMKFAWRVLKHVKSNGILVAKNEVTLGVGPGQVSRVGAVEIALAKASQDQLFGATLASDAFFPFRDSIDRIATSGVKAIIQPGGSKRDEEVIAACDEHGMVMVFTGKRCFNH